jgi:hypothetical protein
MKKSVSLILSILAFANCSRKYLIDVSSTPAGAQVIVAHRATLKGPIQGSPVSVSRTPAQVEINQSKNPGDSLYLNIILPGYEEQRFWLRKGTFGGDHPMKYDLKLKRSIVRLRNGRAIYGVVLQTDRGYVVYTNTSKEFLSFAQVSEIQFAD